VEFVLIDHAQLSIITVVGLCADYQTRPAGFGIDLGPETDEDNEVHLAMRPVAVSAMCFVKNCRLNACTLWEMLECR